MDYLYSLYDALVSINVPSDKARAVVDAMERDMSTTLATKKDLEAQTLATKKDLEAQTLATKKDLEAQTLATRKDLEMLRLATKQDLETLKLATKQDLETLKLAAKQDLEVLKQAMDGRFALVDQRFEALRKDIVTSELKMTVKLGSMMVVGFGLTIAALRLWA